MHFRNQILRAEFGTLKKPVIAFWVNSNFCETVKFEAKRFKTKSPTNETRLVTRCEKVQMRKVQQNLHQQKKFESPQTAI